MEIRISDPLKLLETIKFQDFLVDSFRRQKNEENSEMLIGSKYPLRIQPIIIIIFHFLFDLICHTKNKFEQFYCDGKREESFAQAFDDDTITSPEVMKQKDEWIGEGDDNNDV